MEWLNENYGSIVDIVAKCIALAAAIAVVTPSKFDNDLLTKLASIVNTIGLNWGRARNADDS